MPDYLEPRSLSLTHGERHITPPRITRLKFFRPTTLDVYLASHLLLLIDPAFPDPLLRSLLKESYPTLCEHARRIHLAAFPTTGSDIPIIPAQNYSIGSLIPWPTRVTKKEAPKPKSPEEIKFERMKWGWIGLATFSVVFYIAQSGIVQAVLAVAAAAQNSEDGELEIVLEAGEDDLAI